LSLGANLERPHAKASDLELAKLASHGDELAFEEIVRRYSPRIFRVASQFLRKRENVEEAAQEVFLRAYTQLPSFEGRGALEGWLSRIAVHVCLNILRAAGRRPEALAADLSEDESGWLEQQSIAIAAPQQRSVEGDLIACDLAEKLLQTLAPEDRTVLLLVDGNDFSIKEVAVLIGWTESKVKIRAMRARQQMRQAIEKLLASNKSREGLG